MSLQREWSASFEELIETLSSPLVFASEGIDNTVRNVWQVVRPVRAPAQPRRDRYHYLSLLIRPIIPMVNLVILFVLRQLGFNRWAESFERIDGLNGIFDPVQMVEIVSSFLVALAAWVFVSVVYAVHAHLLLCFMAVAARTMFPRSDSANLLSLVLHFCAGIPRTAVELFMSLGLALLCMFVRRSAGGLLREGAPLLEN